MKGKFITFVGCEGAGKSKQVSLLCEYLSKNGIEYILTREPGGTKVAEKIREIILDKDNDMSDECEALLYAASRAEHIKNKILPALNEGKLVICDRFIDSSFAYQAFARNLGLEFVEKVNSYALNYLPDLTLFFDISPEMAFKRKGGVDKTDRLELQGMDFHNKVYEGFVSIADKYGDRIVKVDCLGKIEETHANVIRILKEKGIINA